MIEQTCGSYWSFKSVHTNYLCIVRSDIKQESSGKDEKLVKPRSQNEIEETKKAAVAVDDKISKVVSIDAKTVYVKSVKSNSI